MLVARKPDSQLAYKQLKRHLVALGAWVAFVRVLPYALQAVQNSKQTR